MAGYFIPLVATPQIGNSGGGGGGGSGVFVATYNVDSENTCDKTYAEVAAAVSSGAYLFHLTSPMFPGVDILHQYVVVSDGSIEVHFLYARPNGSGGHNITVYMITHTADGITVSFY